MIMPARLRQARELRGLTQTALARGRLGYILHKRELKHLHP